MLRPAAWKIFFAIAYLTLGAAVSHPLLKPEESGVVVELGAVGNYYETEFTPLSLGLTPVFSIPGLRIEPFVAISYGYNNKYGGPVNYDIGGGVHTKPDPFLGLALYTEGSRHGIFQDASQVNSRTFKNVGNSIASGGAYRRIPLGLDLGLTPEVSARVMWRETQKLAPGVILDKTHDKAIAYEGGMTLRAWDWGVRARAGQLKWRGIFTPSYYGGVTFFRALEMELGRY